MSVFLTTHGGGAASRVPGCQPLWQHPCQLALLSLRGSHRLCLFCILCVQVSDPWPPLTVLRRSTLAPLLAAVMGTGDATDALLADAALQRRAATQVAALLPTNAPVTKVETAYCDAVAVCCPWALALLRVHPGDEVLVAQALFLLRRGCDSAPTSGRPALFVGARQAVALVGRYSAAPAVVVQGLGFLRNMAVRGEEAEAFLVEFAPLAVGFIESPDSPADVVVEAVGFVSNLFAGRGEPAPAVRRALGPLLFSVLHRHQDNHRAVTECWRCV